MTTDQFLKSSERLLEKAGIGTARLDCLVLLEDATGKDRSWILARPELDLKASVLHELQEKIERRATHEPLAYIRGKTEFYGREFIVDKRVLEPRPESETMIELLLDLVKSGKLKAESGLHIIDVGTGSGALGLTTALELVQCQLTLIDLDPDCLKVARANAKQHSVTATILRGDLLEPLSPISLSPHVFLCNLPYVPDSHTINKAAMQEPKHAIFGGADGLDLYRKLFEQLKKCMDDTPDTVVITESLPSQHEELRKIAEKMGYEQIKEDDFIQVFEKSI